MKIMKAMNKIGRQARAAGLSDVQLLHLTPAQGWATLRGSYVFLRLHGIELPDRHRTGRCITWHDNGQVASQGTLVTHPETGIQVLQGAFLEWDRHGNKTREANYYIGVLHGAETAWHGYPVGNVMKSAGFWAIGFRTGEWSFWNTDGLLTETGKYAGGVKIGTWRVLNDSGVAYHAVSFPTNNTEQASNGRAMGAADSSWA